jgi:hypothetical protein
VLQGERDRLRWADAHVGCAMGVPRIPTTLGVAVSRLGTT